MWRAFFEMVGAQGRRATVFILAFVSVLAVAPILNYAITYWPRNAAWPDFFLTLIGGLVLIGVVSVYWVRLRRCRRDRAQRKGHGPASGPLAFEEWRTARSKLLKNRRS